MSRLEDMSEWLSPIVVKDVRQMVRTRQFFAMFALGLGAGLVVAAFGGVDLSDGSVTSGAWTFNWISAILLVIGMVVVPLHAFSTVRREEMERTFELIRITRLSPRRIIIGKVLAQGVTLLTLFSAMAPFLTMSYLLGGVSIGQILLFLPALSLWSLWSCAAGALLSLEKSITGVLSASAAVLVYLFGWMFLVGVCVNWPGAAPFGFWFGAGDLFSATIFTLTFCAVTMINIILLAARRLGREQEDRPTALRVGLTAQLLLLLASPFLSAARSYFMGGSAGAYSTATSAFRAAAFLVCAQIAVEGLFLATANIVHPRNTLRYAQPAGNFTWITAIFRPGGANGIAFVLVHMGLLLAAAWFMEPGVSAFLALAAFCGYVCFFTGLPAYVLRLIAPRFSAPLLPRFGTAILLFVFVFLLPIIRLLTASSNESGIYRYSDLLNPVVTLYAWNRIDDLSKVLVLALGAVGLFTYVHLVLIARRLNHI